MKINATSFILQAILQVVSRLLILNTLFILLFLSFTILKAESIDVSAMSENWKLPFENGSRVIVTQGYNNNPTHSNIKAIDLWSSNNKIVASKSGRVHIIRSGGSRDKWCSNTDECNKLGYIQAGNYLLIDHLDNTFSYYTHLEANSIIVNVGQLVKQGERLATMGGTGYTCGDDNCSRPGAHLHFQVNSDGKSIDTPIQECGLCIPREGNNLISQNQIVDFSMIKISALNNTNFTMDASSNFNQARVWMWTEHRGDNQKWIYNKDTLEIKNLEYNRCLDSGNPNIPNDRWLRINDCHGGENQKWLINSNGQLYNPKYSNLCLDSYSGNKIKSVLYSYLCHGGENQKWQLR